MWTIANEWKRRRLRRALLITSAEGKGRGQVGKGLASAGGRGVEAGKIVIAGWSGEPFVASRGPTITTTRNPPRGANPG